MNHWRSEIYHSNLGTVKRMKYGEQTPCMDLTPGHYHDQTLDDDFLMDVELNPGPPKRNQSSGKAPNSAITELGNAIKDAFSQAYGARDAESAKKHEAIDLAKEPKDRLKLLQAQNDLDSYENTLLTPDPIGCLFNGPNQGPSGLGGSAPNGIYIGNGVRVRQGSCLMVIAPVPLLRKGSGASLFTKLS